MARALQASNHDKKNVLVVDALNLAFRWKHADRPSNMPDGFLETIRSLAKSYECGTILVVADGPGGSKWRKEKHPGYKGSRKLKYENETQAEKDAAKEFFGYYEKTLANLQQSSIPLIRYPGVEADDIAAFIVENRNGLDINTVWLITSDQDWDLLIEPDVSRFSTVTKKEVTVDTWEHPVDPENFIHLKTLVGDKGDDVPGVEGVGPVRAAKLIGEYGTVFDIIAALPLSGKAAYIQNLNKSADSMMLSYELMDLRSFHEDAIGEQLVPLKEQLNGIFSSNLS